MKKITKYISLILLMSLSALPVLPATAGGNMPGPEKSTISPQMHIPRLDFQIRFLNGINDSRLYRDSNLSPFYDYTRELTGVSREEETFAFFTAQIKKLIGASGVTIYIIDKNESGDILYRNIWRQGMKGTWSILWRTIPPGDEKAVNISKATEKNPFLYIRERDKSPFVHSPWLLKDVFMYRFGAESVASKTASWIIDRLCSGSDRPARYGLAIVKALRPQWLKRVNESLNITIFDQQKEPVAQILINNWESGKPLFSGKSECRKKLKTISLLARQTAMALCYHRNMHYLSHKYPDPKAGQDRLKTIARIYEEDVGRSVHSSKNFLFTGLPGWANLMLRRIKKQDSASAVFLAQQLETQVAALKRLAADPVLEKILVQFEERDMRNQMEAIQRIEKNPESLIPPAEITPDLVRNRVSEKSRRTFDAFAVWDSLTQLYFDAASLPEINRIHEQARELLQDNPLFLEREMDLYRFATMAAAPGQHIRIQEHINSVEESNIALISRFIEHYRPFYENTVATIAAMDKLAASDEAQPFRESFNTFATFGKDYITINKQFFELTDHIIRNIQPSERSLDIKTYNAAQLLSPYKFPLDILSRKQLPHIVGVEYSFSYSLPDNLWIKTDATELNLIMDNLFSNAVKYSDKGGNIELNVRTVQKQPHGIPRNMIAISLKDEGRGIAPEKLRLVGKHHQRLGAEHDPAIKGSGIGLAYVKSCVEKMNGYFEVYSEGPGKGSVFTVYLPADNPPRNTAPAAANVNQAGIPAQTGISLSDAPAHRIPLEQPILTSI